MKKFIYIGVFLVSVMAIAQGVFKKVDVAGKIKMEIPNEMNMLTAEQVEQQFGLINRPLAVFQDGSSFVSLSINERVDSLSRSTKIDYQNTKGKMDFDRDLNLEKQFYKASLSSWFNNAKFLQDTIKTINKKEVIVFELEGEIEGKNRQGEPTLSKNYTYVQYVLLKDKRYTFTFNCPLRKKDYWQPLAKQAMESIKVK